jgi:C4-dicarboxylate-binding protein DctP
MKKAFALFLAICTILSLSACGSGSSSSSGSGSDSTESAQPEESVAAESQATEEAEESPAAEEESASGDTDWDAIAAEIEPLTINFNSTYSEVETNGTLVTKFQEYLDELSGGKITLNVYWGGTVYDDSTQFQALIDGAVDMISINQNQDADYVPYLGFGSYGIGSAQNVMDCWNYILFEDPETSALIQEEAAGNNMYYLNNIGNGIDCLYSNFEWDTLDEFIAGSTTVGSGDNAKFEAMGMNCAFVVPPEAYDALQRGICDSTCCALAAGYSMSWDEVAPNIVTDGLWACGGNYTVNLDFWNGLSEGQQAIIQEAANRLEDYSLQMNADAEAGMIAEIEGRSNITVKSLSDEDAATFFKYVFDATAADALNRVAGDEEKTANMITILETAASFYDYDWQP